MKKIILLITFILFVNATTPEDLKMCNDGIGEMCVVIGMEYENPKRLEFYKKGCKFNDANGCELTADLFYEKYKGFYESKNKKEAIKYYKRGCELNSSKSCYMSGFFSEEEGKISEALDYYKKGCELNNGKSCFNLAELLSKTKKAEYYIIKDYYKKACNLKVKSGCKKYDVLNFF